MPVSITSTTFQQFCSANGPARVTVVKNAKNKYTAGYQQGPDYWKPFRDELLRVLRGSGDFDGLLNAPLVQDRLKNYRKAIDGVGKWIGRKDIELQPCKPRTWRSGDLSVKVHPEFAALIDSRLFVVKLWLKPNDALVKARADTLLHLLDLTHGSGANSAATVAVLDVARSKFIKPTRLVPGIDALLHGEAASFVRMWDAL